MGAAPAPEEVNPDKFCILNEAPPEEAAEAAALARRINPANARIRGARPLGAPAEELSPAQRQLDAAISVSRRWSSGRTLRVRFLNGHPTLRRRVLETAAEWSRHANIRFQRSDTDVNAEIRIRFANDNVSDSYLGTDALRITNRNTPTMRFGWLRPDSPDDTLRAVVLHEFGHALGLIHEHQQPTAAIPWDSATVVAHYARYAWTPEDVSRNVFQRYDAGQTQYSRWDRHSIMQYPIPASHTRGRLAVGWNDRLSPTDVYSIRCWYSPASGADPGCPR